MAAEGISEVRQRSYALDVLRGVAILIVVLAHAMQVSLQPGEESIIWMRFIRPFQMPLLFLVSGWALAFSYPARSQSVFLVKKVQRLFVPYVAWMLVTYAMDIYVHGTNTFSAALLWDEFWTSEFWFLRALFLMYLVVWLGAFAHEKWFSSRKWFPVFAVILGLVVVLLLRKIDMLRPTANGWFYQWFLTGYLAHVVVKAKGDKIAAFMARYGVKMACGCAGLLALMIALVYMWDLSQNLVAYLTIPAICMVVVGLVRFLPVWLCECFKHWGMISLAIYAIHHCLFMWTGKCLAAACPEWAYGLRVVLLTVAWMAGCELLNWLFKQTRLTRMLMLGEK